MAERAIVVDTSEGFVDLRFPVIQSRVADGGEAFLVLAGNYGDDHIQITLQLQSGMLPNDFSSESTGINSHPNGIRISADADSAKSLASMLVQQYSADRMPELAPLDLSFTAIALDGDPREIESEEIKFKLFHETGSTDDEEGPEYFEMFLNVNLGSNIAELREKDTDFRTGLLNALKAGSK